MARLKSVLFFIIGAALLGCNAHAQFGGPFNAKAELAVDDGEPELMVAIEVPAEHYLYADKFAVDIAPPAKLEEIEIPAPKTKYDKFMEQDISIYEQSPSFIYRIEPNGADSISVTVDYQGCGPDICFAPEQKKFEFPLNEDADATVAEREVQEDAASTEGGVAQRMAEFEEIGRATGYMNPDDFIAFLDAAESGEADSDQFAGKSLLVIVLLILVGGAALNLTPCVLPMIPINIAILGAGAQAKSKLRGLLLGATYGAGIAVAYGALGLLVVLTGARFGALNSSPWFNFGIAALFVVLSLSMFGVFNIDLSRFQSGSGKPIKGGRFMTAFGLGLVAALLAGACVAPVVISVLLYSTTLYADGNAAGLLLPFLLGVGMALPWPFAGAGLSFLPKAGAWMERVKYVFGIIILLAALYYAKLGYSLLKSGQQTAEPDPVAAEKAILQHAQDGWLTSLDQAIAQSRTENKPIFIDFWAVWCKSCLKMDKTTFKDPQVLERLDGYVKLKIDADRKDPDTAYAMDRFVEVGLPTYVIIGE